MRHKATIKVYLEETAKERAPRRLKSTVRDTLSSNCKVKESVTCDGSPKHEKSSSHSPYANSKGRFEIDYNFCNGCGIYATICPKEAIKMVLEE